MTNETTKAIPAIKIFRTMEFPAGMLVEASVDNVRHYGFFDNLSPKERRQLTAGKAEAISFSFEMSNGPSMRFKTWDSGEQYARLTSARSQKGAVLPPIKSMAPS